MTILSEHTRASLSQFLLQHTLTRMFRLLCAQILVALACLALSASASPIGNRAGEPNSPNGGRLIRIKPCSSSATVPAFVNSKWAKSGEKSTATSVYISQHGAGTDFDYYFSSIHNIVGNDAAVIAPAFYQTDSARAPSTWYDPSTTLAWSNERLMWGAGFNSVLPSGSNCASYSVYDDILRQVTDRSRFPNLKNIYWVGHSGGANMVQRWSAVASEPSGYRTRYIVANAAHQAYFSGARPNDYDQGACPNAKNYPWQFTSTNMSPYVSQRFSNADDAFRKWASRDVVILVGDYDTNDRYSGGMQTCETAASGGVNRRERNYAHWAYSVLKAGANQDVSGFTGYAKLKASVKAVSGATYNHKLCVVDKVGHIGADMYNSACGRQALFNQPLTANVGPRYP